MLHLRLKDFWEEERNLDWVTDIRGSRRTCKPPIMDEVD